MFRCSPLCAASAFALASAGCMPAPVDADPAGDAGPSENASAELVYQIFVRSFRDSNGDRHGDLRGVIEGLEHLQSIGVTTLLLTPLYPSGFYHNYFADDFEGVDPEYGDMAAAADLIAAVRARGMKLYVDQEIHYVTQEHAWFRGSINQPDGPYGGYVLFEDAAQSQPAGGFLGLNALTTWTGETISHYTVNMLEPDVAAYLSDFLMSWVDPNGDGDPADGVHGFRIDHMMDDLDNQGRLTNLFEDFWAPIFARIRATNPDFHIVGEQWDWGFGEDYLERGGVDSVFGFPLAVAIRDLDPAEIETAAARMAMIAPQPHRYMVFAENHDMHRLASVVENDPRRLRAAGALAALIGWTPLLYYGQELGMDGLKSDAYGSDANDISIREAYRWRADLDADGSAIWYAGEALPWWTARYNRSSDGVSVEEQRDDPDSVLNFYRRLSALREAVPALARGGVDVRPGVDGLVRIRRPHPAGAALVAANLGEEAAVLDCPTDLFGAAPVQIVLVTGPATDAPARCDGSVALAPLDVAVIAAEAG